MNSKELLKLKKDRHRKIYWCVMIFSLLALTFGFIIPPPGQIDYSVILSVGLVMLFSIIYIIIDSNKAMSLSVDLDDKKVTLSSDKHKEEEEQHD